MKKIVKKALKGIAIGLLLLFVLALCALPCVFMNSVYGYFPILMLLVLLLLSFGSLVILRSGITIRTVSGDLSCQRGRSMELGLQLSNATPLFSPKAAAIMRISDQFGNIDVEQDIRFTIAGHENIDFGFGLDMNHVGVHTVSMEEIRVYDLFGIFRMTVPVRSSFQAFVLPQIYELEEEHVYEEVLAESMSDTRTTVVGGTDYTGVREYVPGDPMKQIHWKLSAHSRGYLTKMQESFRQQEFAVAIDFAVRPCADREEMLDINDTLIETALSLVRQIGRGDTTCSLMFANRSGDIVRTMRMGDAETVDMVRSFALITEEPDEGFPDAAQILQQESQRQNRSTNVIVVTARVTRALIEELESAKRMHRAPELYDVIPVGWNSRQIEAEQQLLRELEESAIPCTLVSTRPVRGEEGGGAA